MRKAKLNIAILGSRGIPNQYGGFETCAQELGKRLVLAGHDVSVYTSHFHPSKGKTWQGVKRILIKNPERTLKSFGQFIYDMNCNWHSRSGRFDIILHLGYTSDSIWYWIWAQDAAHVVNMDGMEWKRSKYSPLVRRYLKLAEEWAVRRSTFLIADSREIEKYLASRYANRVRYIAYGANIPSHYDTEIPETFGLNNGRYDLIIARMEPENNIEMAINAKVAEESDVPLVIIGNQNQYKAELQKKWDHTSLIKFIEPVYDPREVNSLRKHCRLYLHGHSAGGTNPSLLEAMACGCRIAAHRNPYNEEVLEDNARYYDSQKELMDILFTFRADEYSHWQGNNLNKIKSFYQWDAITEQYERLFYETVNH